jgi:hypothetical protein
VKKKERTEDLYFNAVHKQRFPLAEIAERRPLDHSSAKPEPGATKMQTDAQMSTEHKCSTEASS